VADYGDELSLEIDGVGGQFHDSFGSGHRAGKLGENGRLVGQPYSAFAGMFDIVEPHREHLARLSRRCSEHYAV
jgi:hypothetical protein